MFTIQTYIIYYCIDSRVQSSCPIRLNDIALFLMSAHLLRSIRTGAQYGKFMSNPFVYQLRRGKYFMGALSNARKLS